MALAPVVSLPAWSTARGRYTLTTVGSLVHLGEATPAQCFTAISEPLTCRRFLALLPKTKPRTVWRKPHP
jgi:hypothetical protein